MKSSQILLPLAAAAALLAAGCRQEAAAPTPFNVRTVTARPAGELPREAGPAFLGVVRGDAETSLSFKVSGQITRIGPRDGDDWNEGAAVPAGTELAQLDTANFVSAVAAARARAELARASFARNGELYAAANLSKNDFEASRAQKETSEADLAQAEQALRDTTLRAPYGGVILSRAAKSGEFAGTGRAVLRLGDFRRVSLELGVPDTLLGELAVGQEYMVRMSAFEGETFTGVISEIGTAAAENSRLFRVVLKIDNTAGRLKSGMTASVRLGGVRPAAMSGVMVPLSALVAANGPGSGSAVYIVTGRTVQQRNIRTGDIIGSSIVVASGLTAGDQVVTLGAGQLHEGAEIAVIASR
jgi:RND family efflux transporter MFP subunit